METRVKEAAASAAHAAPEPDLSGTAEREARPSLDGQPEHYGQVLEINWRATRIITNELVILLIPNANIAKGTARSRRRRSPVWGRRTLPSRSSDAPSSCSGGSPSSAE